MNRLASYAIIVGAVLVTMRLTHRGKRVPPITRADLLDPGPTIQFAPSPYVLGVGRTEANRMAVPPSVVELQTLLAGQDASGVQAIDTGGYIYQTAPSTYSNA